jgi:hypothetical protein
VLIVEDDSDGNALRQLAQAAGVDAIVDWLPADGIGNIKRRAEALIRLARDRVAGRGCVAIVVDGDGRDPTVDEPHRTIQQACSAANVPLIVAREALEAWFLTDPGICSWLGVPRRPHTGSIADPKRRVAAAYYQKTRRPYQRRLARLRIAQQATGPAHRHNNSLAETFVHLTECRVVGQRLA